MVAQRGIRGDEPVEDPEEREIRVAQAREDLRRGLVGAALGAHGGRIRGACCKRRRRY